MAGLFDCISVVDGDITTLAVEAIVNAANERLAGGGGVDGAIHRAAGYDRLQAACRELGGCPTGEVRTTPGFNLKAKYILHTVGPVWHGGIRGEEKLLRSCYRNCMEEAQKLGVGSIAFPAISCGVYGYPAEKAVVCAVDEVIAHLKEQAAVGRHWTDVVFCCFDRPMSDLYRRYLESLH